MSDPDPANGIHAPSPPTSIGIPFQDLPRAHGEPLARGLLRVEPQDFQVEELLGFEPDGAGEHRLLWVRKTDTNTEWVARRLAELAGVPASDVGFAGLKDRRAVTSQWFSVPRPKGGEPDWSRLAAEGIEVLEVQAHRRKLRRGSLRGNRFQVLVRDLGLEAAPSPDSPVEAVDRRCTEIRCLGVPNYFGEQRFGHAGANLSKADALFRGALRRPTNHQRGLWLSAARSELFNRVLAHRVSRGDWARPLPGDCLNLDGSHSFFRADVIDSELIERCWRLDLHPTGPLWGRGEPATGAEVHSLELKTAETLPGWAEGLARFRLVQERRALRVPVRDLAWELSHAGLALTFSLPAGAYATAVLRELVTWGSGEGI
ncbi:MAG: tRNA pseudouridine(13) synthase TruD [Bdellovibrio bacteriovorus]